MSYLQSFQKRQYLTIHHPQSNVISGFGRSSRRSCAGKLRESQKCCCLCWTPLHPIASIQIAIELIGKCSGENLSGLEVYPRDKQHIDNCCCMLLQCLQIFVHSGIVDGMLRFQIRINRSWGSLRAMRKGFDDLEAVLQKESLHSSVIDIGDFAWLSFCDRTMIRDSYVVWV